MLRHVRKVRNGRLQVSPWPEKQDYVRKPYGGEEKMDWENYGRDVRGLLLVDLGSSVVLLRLHEEWVFLNVRKIRANTSTATGLLPKRTRRKIYQRIIRTSRANSKRSKLQRGTCAADISPRPELDFEANEYFALGEARRNNGICGPLCHPLSAELW